jgi:hypothetical protein
MQKFFKTLDGIQYMDVTPKAYKIFDEKLFDLHAVWQKEDKTYKIPIQDKEDIDIAIQYGKYVCIEIGKTCQCGHDRWADADKITHNGYVYVRYSDIKL